MKHRLITALCCAALVVSCMPKLYPPQVDVPEKYLFAGQNAGDSTTIPVRWWEMFCDPELNLMVEKALASNRNLLSAVSRITEARDQLAVARAQFLPSVGLGISAEGDYTSPTRIVQEYAVEPSLSWEVSLFGALKNTDRAARAQILASEWAWRGVMLSLTAEIATTYFTLRQYQRDLAIARRSYGLRRESAALIDSMFRYGMSDGVALEQARSLVYTAAADIPQYRRAVEQTRLSLATLLGETPVRADTLSDCRALETDCRPEEIPAGLPSALLERRPDVMEAYYTMQQAAFEVGIARAARYPSIALTGKGGIASTSIKGLTSGDPWAWNAVGSLTQPIFSFGRLRRKEMAAKESYMQSVFAYEQTVLEAFADVETALSAIGSYRQQTEQYEKLVEANRRVADMTRALYLSGMSDYLSVIDAERSLYESQMELVNLTAQQYIACIDLCKALGGGW